jgi:ABC-2 type transport system permease protein
MFFRVRQEIFWVFFLPVFLLLLLGPVLKDMAGIGSLRPEDVNFPVGVVDHDQTGTSREFVEALKNAPEFTVTELTEEEARQQARSTHQRIVVIFPRGFEQALRTSGAKMEVLTDSRALPLTEMAFNLLRETVEGCVTRETRSVLPVAFIRTRIVTVDQFFDFIDFLIPGVIAMAVMPSCIFSLAPTIVRLREQGIMRRLWVTPLSRSAFVLSHVLFRLFIAASQTILILVIARTFFRTSLALPIAAVALLVLLGNLTAAAMAFTIAGFAKTPEVASTIANVVSIPMLMLCGIFLPLEIMPPKIHPLIWALPLTHLAEGLRRAMNVNGRPLEIWPSLLVLTAYLAVFFAAGLLAFKWERSSAGAAK